MVNVLVRPGDALRYRGGVPEDHWPIHARQWNHIGGPLRPSPEDLAVVRGVVATWEAEHQGAHPSVLVLGVTPELAKLPWPSGARVLAVDRSEAMIAAVWSGAGTVASASAVCGDWRALPCAAGSLDLVVGDGCFSVLAYPTDYRAVSAELRRVLSAGGRFVMRFFVPPPAREDVVTIAGDLRAGRIGTFHAFKWRLAMATQQTPEQGASLERIWSAWRAMCPDPARLAAELGWSDEAVATMDAYRDARTTYSFPTLAEIRAVLGADLEELSCHLPRYELGDRCPTLVWRAR